MNTPLVTIIIPVYNRPNLIAQAIESVLLQTYQQWELIVVDDISTDTTWEVLKAYMENDHRIKAVKRYRNPKGAPTCRNIGAVMAKGKYLIFWDSDDLMAPWCVDERVRFMEANNGLDFGLFQVFDYNSNSKKLKTRCIVDSKDYLKRFLTFKHAWGTWAVIWLRGSFLSLNGWNENAISWQDPEIHIRALNKGFIFKWGSVVPDGIIRSGLAVNAITTMTPFIPRLENRIKISSELMKILDSHYNQIFIKATQARIYYETYNWANADRNRIGKIAREFKFFTNWELKLFLTIYAIFSLVRKIPLARGFVYRTTIHPKISNYEFYKLPEVKKSLKRKFLDKFNNLNQDSVEAFKKLAKELFIH